MTAAERKACTRRPPAVGSVVGSMAGGAIIGVVAGIAFIGVPMGLFGVVNSFFKWLPPAFLAPYRTELLIGCAVWVAGWATVAGVMQMQSMRRMMQSGAALSKDLAENMVNVQTHELTEAVCLRVDNEHNGLAYVMRSTTGEVFLTMHEGSACQEDIGWRTKLHGHDPRLDEWRPSREMVTATTPHAAMVVNATFGGEKLTLPLRIYEGEDVLEKLTGEGDVQRVAMTWDEFVRTFVTDERLVHEAAECSECDYDLSGTEPEPDGGYRCPECGHTHVPAEVRALRRSA